MLVLSDNLIELTEVCFSYASMINKRSAILYLLIVCLGVAPLLSASANGIGHTETMPANCTVCDVNDSGAHEFCDNTHCILSTGVCGTHASAGYITRLLWAPVSQLSFVARRQPSITRFLSRLEFSIFRPPIS